MVAPAPRCAGRALRGPSVDIVDTRGESGLLDVPPSPIGTPTSAPARGGAFASRDPFESARRATSIGGSVLRPASITALYPLVHLAGQDPDTAQLKGGVDGLNPRVVPRELRFGARTALRSDPAKGLTRCLGLDHRRSPQGEGEMATGELPQVISHASHGGISIRIPVFIRINSPYSNPPPVRVGGRDRGPTPRVGASTKHTRRRVRRAHRRVVRIRRRSANSPFGRRNFTTYPSGS